VATTDKVFIVHPEEGTGLIEKLGVEYDLNPIRRMVEEVKAPDLI